MLLQLKLAMGQAERQLAEAHAQLAAQEASATEAQNALAQAKVCEQEKHMHAINVQSCVLFTRARSETAMRFDMHLQPSS